MGNYRGLVVLLDFLVNFLLLLGTNRLRHSPLKPGRCALGAAVGGLHCAMCLSPGFSFLGSLLWRAVCICGICCVAFGMERESVLRGVIFLFLTLALGGISNAVGKGGAITIAAGAVGLFILCIIGARENGQMGRKIPVVIQNRNVIKKITALHDTGNTLKDPVTGQPVLVLDGTLAWELAGLTMEQLLTPIETMASAPVSGLRLIPYRSVGCSCGMMLALNMDKVMINGARSGNLVAFAPQTIGSSGTYQALSGGIV